MDNPRALTGLVETAELRDFNLSETENPMTDDRLSLAELAAKIGDPDFLRAIGESVLQIIMGGRHRWPDRRWPLRAWRNPPDLAQWLALAFTFNSFRVGLNPEPLAKTDDQLEDLRLLFVGPERADEAPVDLTVVSDHYCPMA